MLQNVAPWSQIQCYQNPSDDRCLILLCIGPLLREHFGGFCECVCVCVHVCVLFVLFVWFFLITTCDVIEEKQIIKLREASSINYSNFTIVNK